MTTTKQTRPAGLARLFSLEGAMAAFGFYSLLSGLYYGEALWIFWGVMIVAGLALLALVRRRDWKRHWEEMEAAAAGRHPRRTDAGELPRREDSDG